jgi:hypothetical protein
MPPQWREDLCVVLGSPEQERASAAVIVVTTTARTGRSMSAPADSLGLLTDDGEDPGIAWCCRDSGEHLVQYLGHHRRCRSSPDTPASRFVDQAGRGHLQDVGLPADALAQVHIRPHELTRAVGQFEGRLPGLLGHASRRPHRGP